jgi:transposase, IS30 family
MQYQHFSIEERETIQELLWQKSSIRDIARVLVRSPSSISRELKRNKPHERNRYTPRLSHERALDHRTHRGKRKLEKDERLKVYTVFRLKLGWSPEQIAATCEETTGISISHEAIYQYIYAQIHRDGYGYLRPGREDLRPYLARRRRRRMKKGLRKSYRVEKGPLPSIDERPKEVYTRTEVGHWEDDSIVYTPTCPIRLRTTNELASGVVFIRKTKDRTMADANRISVEKLQRLPAYVRKTLTRDRGSENMGYEELEQLLGFRCYFAHAYHSWERGSNENLNGLIRRFFPKKTDFRTISDEEIQWVEYLLNTRPRKRLGWKTPYQVFYERTGIKLAKSVALRV